MQKQTQDPLQRNAICVHDISSEFHLKRETGERTWTFFSMTRKVTLRMSKPASNPMIIRGSLLVG